jgi:Delta3-Delta2-enoyl-CoA isomerase
LETVNLLGRIAVFPAVTVAMVTGGAVAGGCMFAFAHDYIYATEKAKFSVKEAEFQVFFPPGMLSIIGKRQAYPHVYRDMTVFSKEFQADEALHCDLIDDVSSEDMILSRVQEKADKLAQYG